MMRSTLLFFTLLGVTFSAPSPAQENESVDHQSEFTIMSPINILSDVMRQFEDIFRIIFDKFGNYTNMNVTTWEVLQVNGTPYFLNTTITEGKKSPHVTVHFSTLAYSKSHKNESKDEMGKDKKKKDSKDLKKDEKDDKDSKKDEKDDKDSKKDEKDDKDSKKDEKDDKDSKKDEKDDKNSKKDRKDDKDSSKNDDDGKMKKRDEKSDNEDKSDKKSEDKSSKKSKDKKNKKTKDDSDDDSDEEDS